VNARALRRWWNREGVQDIRAMRSAAILPR
jgi:hypothetical protein